MTFEVATDEEAQRIWASIEAQYWCPYCRGKVVVEELRFPSKSEPAWEIDIACMDIDCECGALRMTLNRDGTLNNTMEQHSRNGCQESLEIHNHDMRRDGRVLG